MRLPEFTQSTTFRWTLGVASAFALAIFGSFAFVYVEAIQNILTRTDAAITEEADIIASQTMEQVLQALRESGGGAVAVSDADITRAAAELQTVEGIDAAPEGGAALAAAIVLRERGLLQERERTILFNTGAGWLYRG